MHRCRYAREFSVPSNFFTLCIHVYVYLCIHAFMYVCMHLWCFRHASSLNTSQKCLYSCNTSRFKPAPLVEALTAHTRHTHHKNVATDAIFSNLSPRHQSLCSLPTRPALRSSLTPSCVVHFSYPFYIHARIVVIC
jgi:hypothetical protein